MQAITDFLNQLLNNTTGSFGFGQALIAMAVAYLGGILSSLTPCVYPMIPITVGVIGGNPPSAKSQTHPEWWREVVLRSMSYIAGMTVIYSFLGVTAGLTGKLFGSLTNSPGWYLALGIIMNLAALGMIEVISINPALWWNWIKRKILSSHAAPAHIPSPANKEMTLWGAFGLGASSGFIAAPCTTPVLTAILAYIAKTQSIGIGLALMAAFSLGLSTLLLAVATFTGAIQILPRSGQWMRIVKVISGLILLGFAEYLIYRAGALGGI